jgi:hypothetical protein
VVLRFVGQVWANDMEEFPECCSVHNTFSPQFLQRALRFDKLIRYLPLILRLRSRPDPKAVPRANHVVKMGAKFDALTVGTQSAHPLVACPHTTTATHTSVGVAEFAYSLF